MKNTAKVSHPRISTCLTVVLLVSLGAVRLHAEEAFLVRDIDTTREPYVPPCHQVCVDLTNYGSLIAQLTSLGDLVVFEANDRTHGFELWTSDGSDAGTRTFDLCPGECGSEPFILGRLEDQVLFWARDDPDEDPRLWATRGTPESTFEIDLGHDQHLDSSLYEHESAVFDDQLFFQFLHAQRGQRGLWRTDGTTEGSALVMELGQQFVYNFVVWNDQLVFHQDDLLDTIFYRLPAPDGEPVRFLEHCRRKRGPTTAFRGELVFSGVCDAPGLPPGAHLVATDGTPEGTRLLHDLSGLHSKRVRLQVHGDWLYFLPVEEGRIWRTDGTVAGTELVGEGFEEVGSLTPAGHHFFFTARRAGEEASALWRAGDGGAVRLATLDIGFGRYPPSDLHAVGARVFFSADDGEHGHELWQSAGTPETTCMVDDVAPGPESSHPTWSGASHRGFDEGGLVRAGDLVYFPAWRPDIDTELFALELDEIHVDGLGAVELTTWKPCGGAKGGTKSVGRR